MRLALCQMNATVGDIAGNTRRIREGIRAAREAGADLVLFPELAVTGYPPEDLLLREHFLADTGEALRELAADTHGVVALVGFPEHAEGVFNAAAVLGDGEVRAVYRKVHLPNYGVFDEQRYFRAGSEGAVIDIGEQRVGLTVCEDIWQPGFPASDEALAGAALIVNISASPYHAGKGREREQMFIQRARQSSAYLAFCALVGGQDELVFDGQSCVIDPTGEPLARAAQFREELLLCDVQLEAAGAGGLARMGAAIGGAGGEQQVELLSALPAPSAEPASPVVSSLAQPIEPVEAEVYAALMLGLSDYVNKNGFEQVVLGVSGGIDSALVACVAVDALGAGRVNAAIMPSRFSSSATQQDARALSAGLGIGTHELPIESGMTAYTEILSGEFSGGPADLTEENIQARIRGNLLMALSNKFGWLVLTTGNKSEMSVGYTTLYGDAAGGFAVIKDVPKTLVYRLCEWRNSAAGAPAPIALAGSQSAERFPPAAPIPPTILERAPSAELRHAQRDQDSLPPYELLDRILYGYIELDQGRERLIAEGLPEAEVDQTIRLVDHAEYKRRQAPPGIKITTRAFGRDRRMPITNRYRG